MKISRILCLMAAMVALGAQAQTQGTAPASSYSNARAVDIMIRPVIPPSLSVGDVNTLIRNGSNAYGKSWTSYFLGQSKSGVTINYDGTLSDQNYGPYYIPGVTQTVWPAPQGATPVDAALATYCSNQNNFAYGGYTIAPVFTQAALLNGGPPYDWQVALKPENIFSFISGPCTLG